MRDRAGELRGDGMRNRRVRGRAGEVRGAG